ncbi:MAG: hypothetical protein HGA45_42985 [Chloroflexales bacterium]|nr:hypothetical protein [Chloroflexales bacterium]
MPKISTAEARTGCAVSVRWLQPATRVFVNGQPALLSTSSGLCQSAAQAPQGAPIIIGAQSRVSGT